MVHSTHNEMLLSLTLIEIELQNIPFIIVVNISDKNTLIFNSDVRFVIRLRKIGTIRQCPLLIDGSISCI
jgi:hypothetical protein